MEVEWGVVEGASLALGLTVVLRTTDESTLHSSSPMHGREGDAQYWLWMGECAGLFESLHAVYGKDKFENE